MKPYEDMLCVLNDVRSHVVAAVDPYTRTRDAIIAHSFSGDVRVLAIGKASVRMARAAMDTLGSRLTMMCVLAVPEHVGQLNGAEGAIEVLPVDHPLPTQRNVCAAQRVRDFVLESSTNTGESHTLLVLLSGGGSAQLALPCDGITIDDLCAVTDALLNAGCTIDQINTVRKHCEQLKGGRLAAIAHKNNAITRVVVLAVSDVLGDDPSVIASGSFSPDNTTFHDALSILDGLDTTATSSDAIQRAQSVLDAGVRGELRDTPKPGSACFAQVTTQIIASNTDAIRSAKEKLESIGFDVVRVEEHVAGSARAWGEDVGRWLCEMPENSSTKCHWQCAIWGGETTVDIQKTTGLGGRCQEAALTAALQWGGTTNGECIVFATDGIDGPTDAAGALIDAPCARTIMNDPESKAALDRHDSYHLLDRHHVLIRTGPTGTNVNDIAIAIRAVGHTRN